MEGYAKHAAPLGSPTASFAWTQAEQASSDALKLALSSAQVLQTFDPTCRAVLTTEASGIAVMAILTKPDDKSNFDQQPSCRGEQP